MRIDARVTRFSFVREWLSEAAVRQRVPGGVSEADVRQRVPGSSCPGGVSERLSGEARLRGSHPRNVITFAREAAIATKSSAPPFL